MTDASYDERDQLWRRHQALNGTLWMLLFAIVAAQFFFAWRQKTCPSWHRFAYSIYPRRLESAHSWPVGAMGLRWFLPENFA